MTTVLSTITKERVVMITPTGIEKTVVTKLKLNYS
jgi:hypothetical protein